MVKFTRSDYTVTISGPDFFLKYFDKAKGLLVKWTDMFNEQLLFITPGVYRTLAYRMQPISKNYWPWSFTKNLPGEILPRVNLFDKKDDKLLQLFNQASIEVWILDINTIAKWLLLYPKLPMTEWKAIKETTPFFRSGDYFDRI